MTKLLSFLICLSVIMTGCYSYYPISDSYNGEIPNPEHNIIIDLKDDSVLKSKPFNHLYADDSTTIYYGDFRLVNTRTGEIKTASGMISELSVDSCNFLLSKDQNNLVCYKGEENLVIFDNLFSQTSVAAGFWTASNSKELIGPINTNDIRDIKVERLNRSATTWLTAGTVTAAVLIIGAVLLRSDMKKVKLTQP